MKFKKLLFSIKNFLFEIGVLTLAAETEFDRFLSLKVNCKNKPHTLIRKPGQVTSYTIIKFNLKNIL